MRGPKFLVLAALAIGAGASVCGAYFAFGSASAALIAAIIGLPAMAALVLGQGDAANGLWRMQRWPAIAQSFAQSCAQSLLAAARGALIFCQARLDAVSRARARKVFHVREAAWRAPIYALASWRIST